MSYFRKFPTVRYDFTVNTDREDVIDVVQDLMVRSSLYINSTDSAVFFEPYRVSEGETPETIAYNKYGDPQLHWTIMYVNQVFDIYADWPLSSQQLNEYCTTKYGADKVNNIHHWEILPERMEVGRVVYNESNQIQLDQSGLTFLNNGTIQFEGLTGNGTLLDEYEYVTYTNFEHEIRENELKRYIQIIRPQFISQFVSLYNTSLKT